MLTAVLPGCSAVDDPQAVVDRADLVVLSVPDEAIKAVRGSMTWRGNMAVVHRGGAHSVDALSKAADVGALVGTFHPLQTFADRLKM